jgi:predicted transcriptional regulator
VFSGEEFLSRQVMFGCASDLMSDVLAFSRAGALLMTGLVNVQTVQTAYIAEITGIVFVRGKKPDKNVVACAQEKQIPLLGSPYSMYEGCGILYRAGISSTMQPETDIVSPKTQ